MDEDGGGECVAIHPAYLPSHLPGAKQTEALRPHKMEVDELQHDGASKVSRPMATLELVLADDLVSRRPRHAAVARALELLDPAGERSPQAWLACMDDVVQCGATCLCVTC